MEFQLELYSLFLGSHKVVFVSLLECLFIVSYHSYFYISLLKCKLLEDKGLFPLLKQAQYFVYCGCLINICWGEHCFRAALSGRRKQRKRRVLLMYSFYNIFFFKKWQIGNFYWWLTSINITKWIVCEPLVKEEMIFKNWVSLRTGAGKPTSNYGSIEQPGSRGSSLQPDGTLFFLATLRLGDPNH